MSDDLLLAQVRESTDVSHFPSNPLGPTVSHCDARRAKPRPIALAFDYRAQPSASDRHVSLQKSTARLDRPRGVPRALASAPTERRDDGFRGQPVSAELAAKTNTGVAVGREGVESVVGSTQEPDMTCSREPTAGRAVRWSLDDLAPPCMTV